MEVTESTVPVRVRRRELIPDSGGAGRQRGGLGQIIELESGEGRPITFFASLERMKYPARGRAGGGDGRLGRACLRSGPSLAGKGQHTIPGGDLLIFETPGGGGYGDPRERPAEAVAEDVAKGLVSREAAERLYAVVLDEAGRLDAEAAACRRWFRGAGVGRFAGRLNRRLVLFLSTRGSSNFEKCSTKFSESVRFISCRLHLFMDRMVGLSRMSSMY